jgi:hypothetical protein
MLCRAAYAKVTSQIVTTDITQISTVYKAIILSLTANSDLEETIVRELLFSAPFKLQLTGKQG